MNYFIADLHFGHENILAYDNREFKNIEEHDAALIKNWNETVSDEDDIYILGDISWHSVDKTIEIFKKLKGRKHLIKGNHDWQMLRNVELRKLFVEITDYKELHLDKKNGIVLSHYPIPCFNKHFYGWIHFYGHVHNSFEWQIMKQVKYQMESLYDKKCRMYNVGCMIPGMNYRPRTLGEILMINGDEMR